MLVYIGLCSFNIATEGGESAPALQPGATLTYKNLFLTLHSGREFIVLPHWEFVSYLNNAEHLAS